MNESQASLAKKINAEIAIVTVISKPVSARIPVVTSAYNAAKAFAAADSSFDSDEAIRVMCEDCGRPIFWDEEAGDYRHASEPERGCFLIAAENPQP